MAGQFFFSYSRDDSAFVLKLARDLRAAGANVWLDQTDIAAGSRWDTAIEQALRAAESVLLVLSPASVASDNVLDEVSYALEEKKRVVPILLRECPVPFRLRRLQHEDFTGDYAASLARLIATMGVSSPPPVSGDTVNEPAASGAATAAEEPLAPHPPTPDDRIPASQPAQVGQSRELRLAAIGVGAVVLIVVALYATGLLRRPVRTDAGISTAPVAAAPVAANPSEGSTPAAVSPTTPADAGSPPAGSGGDGGGKLSYTEVADRLASLKAKIEQNATYRGNLGGVPIFGADRALVAAALGRLEIVTLRQSTRVTRRKFVLGCSDITEAELQALEQYLGLTEPLTRERRGSFENADCSGGRNYFEIWVP